jgi:hypothetical protein
MTIPAIELKYLTNVWANLPKPIAAERPAPFESWRQNQGMALYRTELPPNAKGKLSFAGLHDYATVFVGGKRLGTLNRCKGQREIEIPDVGSQAATLDVLVEGMGHINFQIAMEQDRKGIVGDVKLDGVALKHWLIFPLWLNDAWVASLATTSRDGDRPGGTFFKGTFHLDATADTFFDMRKYEKGVVWVNGRNLGRYWKIGPQQRLYCPASWLKAGDNEVIVLDQGLTEPQPIVGTDAAR